MEAVTYIDPGRQFKTYRFGLLKKYGVNELLMKRLKYAHEMIASKLLHRVRRSRTHRTAKEVDAALGAAAAENEKRCGEAKK